MGSRRFGKGARRRCHGVARTTLRYFTEPAEAPARCSRVRIAGSRRQQGNDDVTIYTDSTTARPRTRSRQRRAKPPYLGGRLAASNPWPSTGRSRVFPRRGRNARAVLQPGDLLLLFTDGVTSPEQSEQYFGEAAGLLFCSDVPANRDDICRASR